MKKNKPAETQAASPPDPESRKPEAQAVVVADHLHSAAIHLLRRVRKQDVATGEGPARLSALSVLVFGGAKTLGELAAAEQVQPPSMTRLAEGLARAGLVERVVDAADRRFARVRLTAEGRRTLQRTRSLKTAFLVRRLERLPASERAALGDLVTLLEHLVEET